MKHFFRKASFVLFCMFPVPLVSLPAPGYLTSTAPAMFELGGGFMTGTIHEYVFVGDYMLSRLDWDVKPLWLARAAFAYNFDNDVILHASCAVGIPARTGVMQDYDWRTTDVNGKYTGEWSNYSIHTNEMAAALFLDLDVLFPVGTSFGGKLFVTAGLSWQHFAMEGLDGHLEYPPGTAPIVQSGKVISYTTDQLLLTLGAVQAWRWASFCSASFSVTGSFLGFEKAVDQHHSTLKDYTDVFYLVPWLKAVYAMSFDVSAEASIGFAVNFSWFPERRGTSYETLADGTSYEFTGQKGGESSFFVGAEINMQFLFQ